MVPSSGFLQNQRCPRRPGYPAAFVGISLTFAELLLFASMRYSATYRGSSPRRRRRLLSSGSTHSSQSTACLRMCFSQAGWGTGESQGQARGRRYGAWGFGGGLKLLGGRREGRRRRASSLSLVGSRAVWPGLPGAAETGHPQRAERQETEGESLLASPRAHGRLQNALKQRRGGRESGGREPRGLTGPGDRRQCKEPVDTRS